RRDPRPHRQPAPAAARVGLAAHRNTHGAARSLLGRGLAADLRRTPREALTSDREKPGSLAGGGNDAADGRPENRGAVPMIREFKEFLIKQNAIALAIGVIIGAAVSKVVSSIVDNILNPIVSLALP